MGEVQSNIAVRLKALIDCRTDKRGKFAQLEEITGIGAETWKSFYYGRQRPNPDMIEAAAVTWPEAAFWLATGIEDAFHGHIDPTREYEPISERTAAKPYFQKLIELKRKYGCGIQSTGWVADDSGMTAQLYALQKIRDDQEVSLVKHDINDPIAF